jgi:murein DD-endopeptidase MepM/ murein hydrolase activator NlpD
MRVFSPVGKIPTIRKDSEGDGHFMSSRKRADGSPKFHDGADFVVTPGQIIHSMINGKVEKYERPYLYDDRYHGVQIANQSLRVEIWYMDPRNTVDVGQYVHAGEVIGVAEDISAKYSDKMTPHIHVRVTMLPFTMLRGDGKKPAMEEYHIDPVLFLTSTQGE